MRVVLVNPWFSDRMGYAENLLPKALAARGVETHLITANVGAYYGTPMFSAVYGDVHGSGVYPVGQRTIDGFIHHRLPRAVRLGYPRIVGLAEKIEEIGPDVVQSFVSTAWLPLELALVRRRLGYRLFTGNHMHASVFPPATCRRCYLKKTASFFARYLPGRFISSETEKCYAISEDSALIAWKFFGMARHKVEISPLGVDTDVFKPCDTDRCRAARAARRASFGFAPDDVVCVYSGRFTEDKNPRVLAEAVGRLRESGLPFRGLFVGDGPQSVSIAATSGCLVTPFVPFTQLPELYHSADIGCWPRQESTSMLDAAACGIPIVISDRVTDKDRIEGNGLSFVEDDVESLMARLRSLVEPDVRRRLGSEGARKAADRWSWDAVARTRIEDYRTALAH